ncbi:NDT80/PhoG like DNA-binding family protein [Xylariales sp. PMI_506]|nr:NDT80/PhoG like DNA-binding family protein [Xylariales sp. PMI_506]
MADLKPESAHGSLWSSYAGSSMPLSTRFPNAMDSTLQHSAASSQQHPGRSRSSHQSVDHSYPYSRYSQDDSDAYSRHQHPSLGQHQSFPNLKRSYQDSEQAPFQEMVQDLRDDGSKLTVNHDHKLLSFRRVQDKQTIVDQHGRVQQLELSAQLHGMFFLSEMPSNSNDGSVLQPELTCYRRNLFQISGSLITPRGQLSVLRAETGEQVPVSSTEVTVSAIESVDGHPVRLIVIPWKTPPPNAPEIPQGPDQEPPSLPLIPFQDDGTETDGEYAVYPIGWRRLQFRIATANNGRRKELQQHFVVHLKVVGTLTDGSKTVLTEAATAPIVVRGRSPRNFQARKEIPLLGSSAGSRGQALVETGLGIVAGPLAMKQQDPKLRGLNLELPRTAFTFNASKLPGTPITMRSNSYPTWSPPGQLAVSQMPASATAAYAPSSLSSEPYHKLSISGASNYTAEPQDMPLQTSMPSVQLPLVASETPAIRTQYAYVQSTSAPPQLSIPTSTIGSSSDSLSVPRYVDSGRPTKSPRHATHQSVHSSSSISNNDSSEYRYGPGSAGGHSSQQTPTPRDYYPPVNSWGSAGAEPNAAVHTYANAESRSYTYPDQYKTNHNIPPLKIEAPQAQASYGGSMGHYNWSPT